MFIHVWRIHFFLQKLWIKAQSFTFFFFLHQTILDKNKRLSGIKFVHSYRSFLRLWLITFMWVVGLVGSCVYVLLDEVLLVIFRMVLLYCERPKTAETLWKELGVGRSFASFPTFSTPTFLQPQLVSSWKPEFQPLEVFVETGTQQGQTSGVRP